MLKKAFDSVDHRYIEKTQKKYGFRPKFIKFFKTIYNGFTASILANGNLMKIINIFRGLKQGDELSCAIFIICIDPLVRNINADSEIKMIKLVSRIGIG